jgi:hypothetical protein
MPATGECLIGLLETVLENVFFDMFRIVDIGLITAVYPIQNPTHDVFSGPGEITITGVGEGIDPACLLQ